MLWPKEWLAIPMFAFVFNESFSTSITPHVQIQKLSIYLISWYKQSSLHHKKLSYDSFGVNPFFLLLFTDSYINILLYEVQLEKLPFTLSLLYIWESLSWKNSYIGFASSDGIASWKSSRFPLKTPYRENWLTVNY